MTTIRLHNTKSRKKQDFIPLDPANVRMYVCGPTVYDRAHLGNARPVVVFDVLYRLLRHVYGADHVTYVRNFTDVDDKINAAALERQKAGDTRSLEALIHERTEETIGWYHADMDAVGALRPTLEPRATDWIGAMIAMTADLIAKGNAYEAEGHVLFAVDSYAAYGALSGRSVDDMIAGARVEVAPYKRNPMDFVLWKPSDAETPGWDSPWGRGRPGWHIECSAMAQELLGASFDIHGGGIDLQFPHHENEIAQSACAHPEGSFARYWMHNEMLQVEGKKMSKSLGNFSTVREVIDEYDADFAIPNMGQAVRLRFLQSHYRSPVDAANGLIEESATKLGQWWFWLRDFYQGSASEDERDRLLGGTDFIAALADDLNTPLAVKIIDDLVGHFRRTHPNRSIINEREEFLDETAMLAIAAIEFLGFDFSQLHKLENSYWSNQLKIRAFRNDERLNSLIERLIESRTRARLDKDFAKADSIRAGLSDAGLVVKDTSQGATWEFGPRFDPAKLEALN